MTHLLILASVAVAALVCGIMFGIVIMGKIADDAMGKALDEYVEEQLKSKEKKQ
jgi:hypothetical protein